jgi:hypothetical protein
MMPDTGMSERSTDPADPQDRMLDVGCLVLFVIRSTLEVRRYLLFVVRSTLEVRRYLLFVTRWTLDAGRRSEAQILRTRRIGRWKFRCRPVQVGRIGAGNVPVSDGVCPVAEPAGSPELRPGAGSHSRY